MPWDKIEEHRQRGLSPMHPRKCLAFPRPLAADVAPFVLSILPFSLLQATRHGTGSRCLYATRGEQQQVL
jgi:hypothetical protein